jgi:hypothetical protein
MPKRFVLPENINQLDGMAHAFLMAVEQATETGSLSKTFEHNSTMRGLNIPHMLSVICQEIRGQAHEIR